MPVNYRGRHHAIWSAEQKMAGLHEPPTEEAPATDSWSPPHARFFVPLESVRDLLFRYNSCRNMYRKVMLIANSFVFVPLLSSFLARYGRSGLSVTDFTCLFKLVVSQLQAPIVDDFKPRYACILMLLGGANALSVLTSSISSSSSSSSTSSTYSSSSSSSSSSSYSVPREYDYSSQAGPDFASILSPVYYQPSHLVQPPLFLREFLVSVASQIAVSSTICLPFLFFLNIG